MAEAVTGWIDARPPFEVLLLFKVPSLTESWAEERIGPADPGSPERQQSDYQGVRGSSCKWFSLGIRRGCVGPKVASRGAEVASAGSAPTPSKDLAAWD